MGIEVKVKEKTQIPTSIYIINQSELIFHQIIAVNRIIAGGCIHSHMRFKCTCSFHPTAAALVRLINSC